MIRDDNEYKLDGYKDGSLFIRKKFVPLIVCPGKIPNTYYYTVPVFNDQEMNREYHTWFYNEFREIISEICKKRKFELKHNQLNPDYKRTGWYLPLAIHLEIIKMWADEKVPIVYDILRPPEAIYGRRNWESYKSDIIKIIQEYLGD